MRLALSSGQWLGLLCGSWHRHLPALPRRDELSDLSKEHPLPVVDPAVWQIDWGVHLELFGSGENIIKYLGQYVCRTAIGDSRLLSVSDTHVSFRWKDRANGDAQRIA